MPSVEGGPHTGPRRILLDLGAVGEPVAVRDRRDAETAVYPGFETPLRRPYVEGLRRSRVPRRSPGTAGRPGGTGRCGRPAPRLRAAPRARPSLVVAGRRRASSCRTALARRTTGARRARSPRAADETGTVSARAGWPSSLTYAGSPSSAASASAHRPRCPARSAIPDWLRASTLTIPPGVSIVASACTRGAGWGRTSGRRDTARRRTRRRRAARAGLRPGRRRAGPVRWSPVLSRQRLAERVEHPLVRVEADHRVTVRASRNDWVPWPHPASRTRSGKPPAGQVASHEARRQLLADHVANARQPGQPALGHRPCEVRGCLAQTVLPGVTVGLGRRSRRSWNERMMP